MSRRSTEPDAKWQDDGFRLLRVYGAGCVGQYSSSSRLGESGKDGEEIGEYDEGLG